MKRLMLDKGMAKKTNKLRYKLHWASGQGPHPALKWVIYDWHWKCPVAYTESRVQGRKLCDLFNRESMKPAARKGRKTA